MQAQLQQIIEVQAEQNQLLKSQLRWLKVSVALLLIGMVGCVGYLMYERSVANRKIEVVTIEPILCHPISLAEDDATQAQGFDELRPQSKALPIPIKFDNQITVPPMSTPAPIELDFSKVIAEAGNRPLRGCDGMCF